MSNTGQIGASDAADFLKKSGLKEGVLHKVRIYNRLLQLNIHRWPPYMEIRQNCQFLFIMK